jgi:hypothetical protein
VNAYRPVQTKAVKFGEKATDAPMSDKETYEALPKTLESPIVQTSNTARTSIETAGDSETLRENARNANPNGFSVNGGVDVKAAEAEFATLQRELSGLSHTSRRLSRSHSKRKENAEKHETDVERIGSSGSTIEEQDEPFDLETTLRGNHMVSYFIDVYFKPRLHRFYRTRNICDYPQRWEFLEFFNI